jgi:hypothetical protein
MENNIETNPMNQDILAGKWKQMRGELKTWWGKLTDDDFERISGQKDKDGVLLRRDIFYKVIAFLGPALELILGAFSSAKQSLLRVGRPLMITLVGFEKCLNKFIGAEFVVELEHG